MFSQKSRAAQTRDMTTGSITGQLLLFAVPLMLGNIFQILYNTVDTVVVGNFVGKEALAAVGSTSMIINILVFFFNGFSVGAGVVIGQYFGAKDHRSLHTAVETTMAMTFLFSVLFTIVGIFMIRPMLHLMSTPMDVFDDACIYLRIYFLGISGLLIYNMSSGILRAVGNTTMPLVFLVITSILNMILDLFFVISLHLGIAGVGYATILSQFISAFLTLLLLTRSKDIYRLTWKDLRIDRPTLLRIFSIALPAGIQTVITTISNVFVQSYINSFGSSCMAGWSCYNKMDQFSTLPAQSLALSVTSFVSQNIGAGEMKRVRQGARSAVLLVLSLTTAIAVVLYTAAYPVTRFFTKDTSVIEFGVLFLRTNIFFLAANDIGQTLGGALRGSGDSRGPMAMMLISYVAVRQIYLFIVTRFISNTPRAVGLGYPLGWVCCMILMILYYLHKQRKIIESQ